MLLPQAAAKNRPQFLVSSNNRNEFSFYSKIFLTIFGQKEKMNRCEKFENELLHPPPLSEKDLLQDGGNDEEAHRQPQGGVV